MLFTNLRKESQEFIKENFFKVFNREFDKCLSLPNFELNKITNVYTITYAQKLKDFIELTYGKDKDIDSYLKETLFGRVLVNIGNMNWSKYEDRIKDYLNVCFLNLIYKGSKLGELTSCVIKTMFPVIYNYGNNIVIDVIDGEKVYLKPIKLDIEEDFSFLNEVGEEELGKEYFDSSFYGFYVYLKDTNNKVGLVEFKLKQIEKPYNIEENGIKNDKFNSELLYYNFDIFISFSFLNKYKNKEYEKDALNSLINIIKNNEFKIKVLKDMVFIESILKVNNFYIFSKVDDMNKVEIIESLGFKKVTVKADTASYELKSEKSKEII